MPSPTAERFESLLYNRKRRYDVAIGPKETKRKSAAANALLEAADPAARSLMVWNAGRFDPRLLTRFRRLETLVVFCWPDSSVEPLSTLTHLRELALDHFPKVRDLSPLANLKRLEQLELATAMSAVQPQRVRSLAPLGRLKHLRILDAFTITPDDRDFDSCTACKRLRHVDLGDWLTLQQRAILTARGINARAEFCQTPVPCAKCDGFRTTLYGTSTRRKWYCSACHAGVIADHRAVFAHLVEAAAPRLSRKK